MGEPHFLILLTSTSILRKFMVLLLKSWIMKNITFKSRNFRLIWVISFLMSCVLSYSQQTAAQKARFGFRTGFYFPDQKIRLSHDSDYTNIYILRHHDRGTAINRIYPSPLILKSAQNDSSSIYYANPLCLMPDFTESELNVIHKQQDLMWEQYYRMWQHQMKIEAISIDVEGIVRGSKK